MGQCPSARFLNGALAEDAAAAVDLSTSLFYFGGLSLKACMATYLL